MAMNICDATQYQEVVQQQVNTLLHLEMHRYHLTEISVIQPRMSRLHSNTYTQAEAPLVT